MTSELVPWRGHSVPVLTARDEVSRYSLTDYFTWVASAGQNGLTQYTGVSTTYGARPAEPIGNNFPGYVEGLLYRDGPVGSAEAYRLRVFGQAPMLWQSRVDGRPGDLYDSADLDLLRSPWVGGTTSDLMKRALLYSDFGGNAYLVEVDGELAVLRPDWVEIILEQRIRNGVPVGFRQVGIAYYEGGLGVGDAAVFVRGEYAHFVSHLPDPLASYRGMSWLTPIIREAMSDKSATDHKLAFFENAATPNLAVSLPKEVTPGQFKDFVELMDERHKGTANAYKTLYTGGGADVTVVGANMQQMDFGSIQGKIETRIANAAGVHPVLLGFSEGMQGSSLNAGNYTAAKRNFVDTTMRDLWQNWCGSMQVLFEPTAPDRLWYDARDIPFLHEDQKDAAEIQSTKASTIASYITAGFEPDSAVAAVDADDRKLLKHSGLVSVQLLPPGAQDTDGDGKTDSVGADSAADEDDDAARAIVQAFGLLGEIARGWTAAQQAAHPRAADGRFRSLATRVAGALHDWLRGDGPDDPLDGFNREQLRKAAKAMDLEPRRGASAEEIKLLLLNNARKSFRDVMDAEPDDRELIVDGPPKKPPRKRATKPAPPAPEAKAAEPDVTPAADVAAQLSGDAKALIDRLEALGSRDDATAEVGRIKTPALRAIGKALLIPKYSGMKVADLRREIVDATVGRRIGSLATRGFDDPRP